MAEPPALSIVVPTFNRAGQLVELLTALRDQDADGVPYDVIVVDNASTDWTREAVHRAAERDPRIVYLLEGRQGASFARNAGVARARAPLVAFLDDDVVPARDWVGVLVAAFERHPDVDCIGGRVEPRWPRHVPPWVTARHCAPLAVQVDRPREFDADHAAACLITANFACRRRVFDELGGFSTDFQRDEDREFNLRLWRAGKRGLYVNELRVFAPIDPSRLTKQYHRRWYETTGRNHARLRFREIIDRQGRLVAPMGGRQLLGAPAFLYRECLMEAARGVAALARGSGADAFLAECRVRYLLSYIRERAQLLLRTPA